MLVFGIRALPPGFRAQKPGDTKRKRYLDGFSATPSVTLGPSFLAHRQTKYLESRD